MVFLHEKEKGCEQEQINIPPLFSQVKIHFLYVLISKRPLSQVKKQAGPNTQAEMFF
jgi:hypothetical protein